MSTRLAGIKNALKQFRDNKVQRRQALTAFAARTVPTLRWILLVIGICWALFLPSTLLGRGVYIDENALQPSQVNTYWSWADVHRADRYLDDLEKLRDNNSSSLQVSQYLETEFKKMGLPASTQSYMYNLKPVVHGVNTYAILSAPRTSGTEAMVVSASWKSETFGDGTLNLRGVATILSLAAYIKKYAFWAKDIIFVIGDGSLEGMHAWLSAYHGAHQSNLDADPLEVSSGVINTALHIDYPGHSFSHLGVFYEGLNGRLPNQDLINSFRIISHDTGRAPVVLYDHIDPTGGSPLILSTFVSFIPSFLRELLGLDDYDQRAKNILRHIGYQSRGKASGVHGLFHRYRIDAFTMFAVPATGPHGFHSLGIVIESTLRTMNNLLERLHASFFFYILTTPGTFLKIGHYLPSAVLISTSLMFGGLHEWSNAGWILVKSESKEGLSDKANNITEWETRIRPVFAALLIMITTHVTGFALFKAISDGWFGTSNVGLFTTGTLMQGIVLFFVLGAVPRQIYLANNRATSADGRIPPAPLGSVIRALNACVASTIISVTCVLNFSLALVTALSLGILLPLSSIGTTRTVKTAVGGFFVLISTTILLSLVHSSESLQHWQMYEVWFSPFLCIVIVPLLLQTATVCVLP